MYYDRLTIELLCSLCIIGGLAMAVCCFKLVLHFITKNNENLDVARTDQDIPPSYDQVMELQEHCPPPRYCDL